MKSNIELNETTIRDILLRNIADRNKSLASIIGATHGGKGKEYSNSFTSILRAFVGNNRNTMNNIESIVESFDGKYAPYHFFDNDTLYAYDGFLGVLMNEIWGKRLAPADLDRAFNKAGQYMFKHSGTASSNFYNADKPITCVKKDTENGKVYAPRRPLSEKAFEKKYGVSSTSCVNDIQKHFMWKRGRLATTKTKTEKVQNEQTEINLNESDLEKITCKYNGKMYTLFVDGVEEYRGQKDVPVRAIKASSKDGVLFTTRTYDDMIYHGALYDMDGNPIRDAEDGEVFYPNSTLKVEEYLKKKERKSVKKEPLFTAYEYTDDDQMKLF